MNEHLTSAESIEGFRHEVAEHGLTPEQLVEDTFVRAREVQSAWREYFGRLAGIGKRIQRALRNVKGALVLASIGFAVAAGSEARAEDFLGPEIVISTGWAGMIPPSEQVLRVPEQGGTWVLHRAESASPTLQAFDHMRNEMDGVLHELQEHIPADVRKLTGESRSSDEAIFLLEEQIRRGGSGSRQFQDAVSRAIHRLEEIEERYEHDLEPLQNVAESANDLAAVMHRQGIRSPEGLRAKTAFTVALARIGVQASYEFDLKPQNDDQEKR